MSEIESATPGERRRVRSRRAILDAALVLIEVSGVDGWSMKELADRVEFTAGALYRYFDGKAALLSALTDDGMAELWGRMVAARDAKSSEDGGAVDRLEQLGLAYLAYALERPAVFRLTLLDMPSRRTAVGQEPAANSPYAVLLHEVQAGLSGGDIVGSDGFGAEEIAFTIWATVHGMAVLELTHLRGFDADFATAHREALKRLLRGLAPIRS